MNKSYQLKHKQGSLYSRGKYILMVDADGATDINELEKIYKEV